MTLFYLARAGYDHTGTVKPRQDTCGTVSTSCLHLSTRISNRCGQKPWLRSLSAIKAPTASVTISSRLLSLFEHLFQQLIEALLVLPAYTMPSLFPTLILCFRHVTL
jgi:hypothetical protein